MISDVLSDAIHEIKRYQREMPDVYNDHKEKIERAKKVMNDLRIFFDTPPRRDQ